MNLGQLAICINIAIAALSIAFAINFAADRIVEALKAHPPQGRTTK